MISLLRGTIAKKSREEVIVDVGGVGYGVFVPLSTYHDLPEVGNFTEMNIYTHMKENSLELFGFATKEEKDIFTLLLSVSGIGPKASLNILSHAKPAELVSCILTGNLGKRKIPGIGPKLASRITTELKDKLKSYKIENTSDNFIDSRGYLEDIISALSNLGYKQNEIENNMLKIKEVISKNSNIENALKESLKVMKLV